MHVRFAVFRGEHRGRGAQVEFHRAIPTGWKVTMTVAGKTIAVQASRDVKPCMTHAKYLLDEHFPMPLDAARPKRKPNAHRAHVVESSFVEHKTGVQLRVVK
jgi:hypothetical protein